MSILFQFSCWIKRFIYIYGFRYNIVLNIGLDVCKRGCFCAWVSVECRFTVYRNKCVILLLHNGLPFRCSTTSHMFSVHSRQSPTLHINDCNQWGAFLLFSVKWWVLYVSLMRIKLCVCVCAWRAQGANVKLTHSSIFFFFFWFSCDDI